MAVLLSEMKTVTGISFFANLSPVHKLRSQSMKVHRHLPGVSGEKEVFMVEELRCQVDGKSA